MQIRIQRKQNILIVFACLMSILSIIYASSLKSTDFIPIDTSQGALTDYTLSFEATTKIDTQAFIRIVFPFQFDPINIAYKKKCLYKTSLQKQLAQVTCTVYYRTITLQIGSIAIDGHTIVIQGIKNPISYERSSFFEVATLLKNVVVDQNKQFGEIAFTSTLVSSTNGQMFNYQNDLVEQGSSWSFYFSLSKSYPENYTLRFIFPQGFKSEKIQCNITGVVDSSLKTRVFPQLNIYDCLNIKTILSQNQKLILSGVVNPDYEKTASNIQIMILQPNSIVPVQKVTITNSVLIKKKDMNVSMNIPNLYRNNTITYIYEINMDSNLYAGDYLKILFTGNWTFNIDKCTFIQGVQSSQSNTPYFSAVYNKTLGQSTLYVKNFSSINKGAQVAFFVNLKTPLTPNNYIMTLTAERKNGGIAEYYQGTIGINQTTGYIKQMRIHPMIQAIKLPAGQTGPIQITLGLINNLPKTNVLTFGKIVIKITPNLPIPPIATNGVPVCYFYGDIPTAQPCTVDSSDPTVTTIEAFTPLDFNFQSSQIPFTVTTQGYINQIYEGFTIDRLVKRYHFHIQFYTQDSPLIPTQVIFTDWIADPIPLTNFACTGVTKSYSTYEHLKCTFTTPDIDLAANGHVHFFRVQFKNSGWDSYLGLSSNQVYADYPCLMYGPALVANPYIKCDLITFTSGPHKADSNTVYMNIYGFQTLPANSSLTFEFPNLKRYGWYNYPIDLRLVILQETWGYNDPDIQLYSQQISFQQTQWINSVNIGYTAASPSITLSNSVINKVTDITINSYDMGTTGVDSIIFQVDQTQFPDIGRGQGIACGIHVCSKFNKPIQYFILRPSTTLAQVQSFTFPSIATPKYAGGYTFKMRFYKGYNYVRHISFTVTITPETLATPPTFQFDPILETQTVLYPNTVHYHKISFTTVNNLPQQTCSIKITIAGGYTLYSDYCTLKTTPQVLPYDTRFIQCKLTAGSTQIILDNMKAVSSGTLFELVFQLISTSTTSTISPTVSIVTYYDLLQTQPVDQYNNKGHSSNPISNTNLATFTTFALSNPQTLSRSPTKGYFGHLLFDYQPARSYSVNNGYYLIFTFTNQFYPYSNQLNLPLSCKINGNRQRCSYSLNPFTVTFIDVANNFTTSVNEINITTQYLEHNGFYYPSTQGKYLLTSQVRNSVSTTLQQMQEYIDILPKEVTYFIATHAHRDISQYNIFEFQFKNSQEAAIPAYDNAVSAGRIYIGFPTKDDSNNNVFTVDLGISSGNIALGQNVPCYFPTGVNYATPITGKKLECRLHTSGVSPNYVYIQIINFNQIPVGYTMQIIMGRIMNPSSVTRDINFQLKINTMNPTTKQQTPLYYNKYNHFIDMLSGTFAIRSQSNSLSDIFQAGAKVGDYNKYMQHTPYTITSGFSTGDWYIVQMDTQFKYSGTVSNCLSAFYQHCIIYPEINWLAIKIANGTLIPVYAYVDRLPTSISRVNTNFYAYTYLSNRASQKITYTMTAANRWMELIGSITGFSLDVLGSQDKLNIGQKDVQILISFNTSHIIYRGGCIQIKFPSDPTLVPKIRPHCRSAVTLGSTLYGDPTGKPATNVQGQIGCRTQYTNSSYSWILTSFDQLPAGSQVKIQGLIDFPTVQSVSLGTGYIVTYSNTDSTNTFTNARIIDYLSTNFPLRVQNKTWQIDLQGSSTYKTQPLRINFVGDLKLKMKVPTQIQSYYDVDWSNGYIFINLWRISTMGSSGGFNGPSGSNLVCKCQNQAGIDYPCDVVAANQQTNYYQYQLKFYSALPGNIAYYLTLTTQNGNQNEGINFPTVPGQYKIQTQVSYHKNSSQQVTTAKYIQVFGNKFNYLKVYSTVNIPSQLNMILIQFTPSNTITTTQQFVIQFPTISNDGISLFDEDLGMGYQDYQTLEFDLYQSTITMNCKVYTGDKTNYKPAKIVCANFNTNILTSHLVKFGFWVRNPGTLLGLAIPLQIYAYDTYLNRKDPWNLVQSAIQLIPTTVSPISDSGNFYLQNTFRQIKNIDFQFTARNTKTLINGNLYILKFNFDLRVSQLQAGKFLYNSGFVNTADAIFMRNCKTIILRVGATSLAFVSSGITTRNILLDNIFYNPNIQLSAQQKQIFGVVAYLNTRQCQIVNYNDAFPTLVPNQLTGPFFDVETITGYYDKSQRDDYRFTFKLKNGDTTGNQMSMAKKISFTLPAFTTNDIQIIGTQCIGLAQSTIEVSDCIIDKATYTIWLTIVQNSNYKNGDALIFQSRGKAFINPTLYPNVNIRNFIVKVYNWPDTLTSKPVLLASSDNYVFMKQDDSQFSNTNTMVFTNTAYDKHSSIQIPHTNYINQFQPCDADAGGSNMRTPLEFKFKVMTAFADKSGTSFYHQINLVYGTYYTSPTTNRNTNDLYYDVAVCQLNGKRIQDCTQSGGKFYMKFQQALNIGQQVSVKFSVLYPINNYYDGLELINPNIGTISLPIQFIPYGGTSYYIETQKFQPVYKKETGGVYPELGIYKVDFDYGTDIQGKINYLDFTLYFSRTDYNGLILQIPVIAQDGQVIYTDPTLMGLQSGSQYPCSVGIDVDVYCYYEKGSTTDYGVPTRIYITKFTPAATLSLRLLFTNPGVVGTYPQFRFKAFGGSYSVPSIMGNQLMGKYSIVGSYKVQPADNVRNATLTGCIAYPDRSLWTIDNYYYFYYSANQAINNYVILEWKLIHPTWKQVSQFQHDTSYYRDYFKITYASNDVRLYLVKKLSYNYVSSSYHIFGKLRNKHLRDPTSKLYALDKGAFTDVTCNVDSNWIYTYRTNAFYGTPNIIGMDVEDRQFGGDSYHWMQIDMTTGISSTLNARLKTTDPADLILVITFYSNNLHSSLQSSTLCSIQWGINTYDRSRPVTCQLNTGSNQFIIKNFNYFQSQYLKIYYYARTVSTYNVFNTQVNIKLFANTDAYNEGTWRIFDSYSGTYSLPQIYQAVNGGYWSTGQAPTTNGDYYYTFYNSEVWPGYAYINSLSTNTIQVKLYLSSSRSFPQVYQTYFRFYTNRLTFGSCQSVTMHSTTYSYNFRSLHSCGGGTGYFWLRYRDFYTGGGNTNNNGQYWPTWSNGQTYTFTVTFSSIGGDVSQSPQQLYITVTTAWYKTWYTYDCGSCGCYNYCRYYNDFYSFIITGHTTPYTTPSSNIFSSTISPGLFSRLGGFETQLNLYMLDVVGNVGPSYGSFLLFKIDSGGTYLNGSPFPHTQASQLGAKIDCQCQIASSLSITSSTSYSKPDCYRYIPSGLSPSIAVFADVPNGWDFLCYFPGFYVSSTGSNLNVDVYYQQLLHFNIIYNYWSYKISYNAQNDFISYSPSSGLSVSQLSWSSRQIDATYYYQLNITYGGSALSTPAVYMSFNYPKPVASFCQGSGSFIDCRVYDSFMNNKYYILARSSSGSITQIRLNGTVAQPPTKDQLSTYYDYFFGFVYSGDWRYFQYTSGTRSSSYLASSTPTQNMLYSVIGNNLVSNPSSFVVAIDMTGRTLYSSKTPKGQHVGSFIRIVFSGFSNLQGCGAFLINRIVSFTKPFICYVTTSNTLEVIAPQDISMTSYLYVTLYTSTVPTSTTYNIYLYDKYRSASDYSLSVSTSAVYSGRDLSGSYNSIGQPTSVKFRKPVYRDYQTAADTAPFRFIINNNYQYVYDYQNPSATDMIYIRYASGIVNGYNYICFVKEYQPGKRHLYKQYIAKCNYYTTNVLRIYAIPGHDMTPDNIYQFTVYRNDGSQSMLLSLSASDNTKMTIQTIKDNSDAIANQDMINIQNYRTIFPLVFSNMYILTREAAATNSLYFEFTANVVSSSSQFFEFVFDTLGLSSFKISNGDPIPCYLDTSFASIAGKINQPTCKGYAGGIDKDGPLKIRVLYFNTFASGTLFKLSFDNFNNPPSQPLFIVPISIQASFYDITNRRRYYSYWDSIYFSDSKNVGVPATFSSNLAYSSSVQGDTNQYLYFTSVYWPYTSSQSDVSQKVVMKIEGGITCCRPYDDFYLNDYIGNYAQLWTNKAANMTVYKTQSRNQGTSNTIYIYNVNNPQPINKETYQQLRKIQLLFYSGYQNTYSKSWTQSDFSGFSKRTGDITADTNLGSPTDPSRLGHSYHSQYPMTYDIQIYNTQNSYSGRQLSYCIIKFTAGVASIDQAYLRYSLSPYIVNNILQVKIGKDSSDSKWILNITGMSDSIYANGRQWIIRMRFFPNGVTLSYTQSVYSRNQQLTFYNTDSQSLSTDGYSSSPIAPTIWQPYQQRYTKNHFQLQRSKIYAKASSSIQRLTFRFTPPYDMSVPQTFKITVPNLSDMLAQNTPTDLTCIIQPTLSKKTRFGVGLHSKCTYSNGVYTFDVPQGGMLTNIQYTVSILQRQQRTTSFAMPTTPKRLECIFIYNSALGLQYGDTFRIDYSGQLKLFSISHLSKRYSTYDMLGVSFTSQFTLAAASLTTPVTQSILHFELDSNFYSQCLGVDNLYVGDQMKFQSGVYFSHYSQPAVSNANTRIMCGTTAARQPIILSVTDYGSMTANTNYYFRFPLIVNPSGNYMPLTYKLKLLYYDSNIYYPIIIGQYDMKNYQQIVTGTASTEALTISPSNSYVQTTMSLSFTYNSWYPVAGDQILVKFQNDNIKALTSLSTLVTLSNGNYNYEYYPNINLCVFKKLTAADSRTIGLGSYPTSKQIQSFQISFIQGYPSTSAVYPGSFTSTFTLTHNSGITVSSFTLISGLVRSNSQGIYKIQFTTPVILPSGSGVIIIIDGYLIPTNYYCKQMSGFVQKDGQTLICRLSASDRYQIVGYQDIAAGTVLSITVYLQIHNNINNYSPKATILSQDYTDSNRKILNDVTSTFALSVSSNYGGLTMKTKNYMEVYIQDNVNAPVIINFKLNGHTLSTGDYILLDLGNFTVDAASLNVQGKAQWKYKIGTIIYWHPIAAQKITTDPLRPNLYKLPVFSNQSTYSMTSNTDILLQISHINPDAFNGMKFNNVGWNLMTIQAYNSANVRLQHQYLKVWVKPYNHISFDVQPVLKYIDAVTPYIFTVTPNISISAGGFLSVQFLTNDGLHPNIFDNTLGFTIPATQSSIQLSCRQVDGNHIISDSNIKCQLFAGNNALSPSKPATLRIQIQKTIPSGTQISFTVFQLKNPHVNSYPIALTLRLQTLCFNGNPTTPCNMYSSTDYLQYNDVPVSIPILSSTVGSISFSASDVSAISNHNLTASYSLNVGDFLRVQYPSQVKVPNQCSILSGNGVCWSYPRQNCMIIKVTTAISSPYVFQISSFTNLYQYHLNPIKTYIYNSISGLITQKFYTQFYQNIITTDSATGSPLAITFTPTLTSNYQLKYNFANIARIEISHIMQNQHIQMIKLDRPSAGTILIDPTYCNITLESDSTEAKPYPYRFKCVTLTSTYIMFRPQNDFPAWTPAFKNKKVVCYVRYTISSGTTSGDWVATAYNHPSSTAADYTIAQAKGGFNIDPYQSPYIYKVNFPTLAFSKRICHINQQCMFYGYLEPTTPQATKQISYAIFTLPKEFNYSNLLSYDLCDMEASNNDPTTVSCVAWRQNSELNIKYTPSSYNHAYKLIYIDTSQVTKLFIAPSYPGSHYLMGVKLFASDNTLVQAMKVNVTTVYGYLLQQPKIHISIPMDSNQYGLFDMQFENGVYDIVPSYKSSSNNLVVSYIQVTFTNAFEFDLGTGFENGAQIACLPVSGLAFNIMGRLRCYLDHSVSSITYPTIRVTGYDKILAGTVVRFRFAGLKTLPSGYTQYIKIAVPLVYYSYGGTQGYIYRPTGFVVGPTTAKVSPASITFSIAQSSDNTVGNLCNYTFTGTLGGGFLQVSTTDYVSIQFPTSFFQGYFSMNKDAICSLAAGGICYSFGIAHIIYLNPASTISTSALSFTINNMINSAYNFDYQNVTIKIRTILGNKINAQGTSTLLKFSKPSPNITAIITSVGSLVGGDSNLPYTIQYKTKVQLPINSVIQISVPQIFGSIYNKGIQCVLNTVQSGKEYCKINDKYQVLIYLNGTSLSPLKIYSFTLTKMTNPNTDLSTHKWYIKAYFDQNIYMKKIVSTNQFDSPGLNLVQVKSCTFQVSLNAYNAYFDAKYDITIICPVLIKESSQMRIYINQGTQSSSASWAPKFIDSQICQTYSNSLYSNQLSVKYDYTNSLKRQYISIYLRQTKPQKQIVLSFRITNPISQTYSLYSQVLYKNFVYLAFRSNSYFITNDKFDTKSINIEMKNYPYNRGSQAVYTFKIANPGLSGLNQIQIQLPSQITSVNSLINCNYQRTILTNYVDLLINQNTNILLCQIHCSKLIITGIDKPLTNISPDGFIFISFYGIKNPALSSQGKLFQFNLFNNMTALSQFIKSLSYQVSQTSVNFQIVTLSIQTPKLLVMSNYSIAISAVKSSIDLNTKIAAIIQFPVEYQQIWDRMTLPNTIQMIVQGSTTITFNSIVNSIKMVKGKLIADFYILNMQAVSKITVKFQFRNPKTQINCTQINTQQKTYTLSIYDYRYNRITAKTLVDDTQCPKFNDRLYQIQIAGKTIIQSGNVQTFLIKLEKPAQYLKITPKTSSSAITFDPEFIQFTNYSSIEKSFNVKVSTNQYQNYTITFEKVQTISQVFYNDIPNQIIQVVEPYTKFYIDFTQKQKIRSVGNPIQIQVLLQKPSSNSFNLLYTHNCSTGFSFNPPYNLFIKAQQQSFVISMIYNGISVFPECSIQFSLSTLVANNYYLKTDILYISGSKSKIFEKNIPIMQVSISKKIKISQSVGQRIYSVYQDQTSNATTSSNLKPVIYKLTKIGKGANTASFTLVGSEQGTVYFAGIAPGTPKTLSQSSIYARSVTSAASYGNSSLSIIGGNKQATLTLNNLQSQQTYLLAAYINSSIGISNVQYFQFKTDKSSNGAIIKLAFTSILDNSLVQSQFSKILRIDLSRMVVLTVKQNLQKVQDTHNNQVMNIRKYIYEIVVAPNVENDSVAPIDSFQEFKKSADSLKKIKESLPSFDQNYPMPTREIIKSKPVFRGDKSRLIQLASSSAKVQVYTAEQSYIYGVIIPQPTKQPLVDQIINHQNAQNNQLDTGFYSSTLTSDNGTGILQFNLLQENKAYNIFITSQSVVPFSKRIRLQDSQTIKVAVKTTPNMNLKKNKDNIVQILKSLTNVPQELIIAVQNQQKSVQRKKLNKVEKKKRVIKN